MQAGIELSLPGKNTAEAVFEVSLNDIDADKIKKMGRVPVNVFGRGGGGVEVVHDGPISLEFVRRIR